MSPRFSFDLAANSDRITLATYVVASVLVVWGADYFRGLSKRLEDEEHFRKLAVEELAHRCDEGDLGRLSVCSEAAVMLAQPWVDPDGCQHRHPEGVAQLGVAHGGDAGPRSECLA